MAEVREPSPDDDVIVVDRDGTEWVRRYPGDGLMLWGDLSAGSDLQSWADLCAKRDPRVYVPQSRLAAVEAELAEARATVARCQAVYDGVHRKDSTLLCSVRCTDLADALAGPPAPKETT